MASSSTIWPTMTDYQEAVQTPNLCFSDADLSTGEPVTNKLGLPRPICGMFASVYEIEQGSSRWAVKCFLRNIPDLHKRYAKIANHLGNLTLPYFVTFEYLPKGMKVRGDKYPIVKMEWVDGLPLNHYIQKHVNDITALELLEMAWIELLTDLRSVDVGHGDLQHGNVLVDSGGNLRLIDYDGMWVPKLKGETSHETGHPDFQSPLRTGRDFNLEMDEFAGNVIHIAIRALMKNPGLWRKYDTGDNLLFNRKDYQDPSASEFFKELRGFRDDEINEKLDVLIKACGGKAKGGGPGRFFGSKKPKDPADGSSKRWKKAKKPKPTMVPAAPAPAPAPAPKPVKPVTVAAAVPPKPTPAPAPAVAGWLADHVSPAASPSHAPPPAPPPPAPRSPAPSPPAPRSPAPPSPPRARPKMPAPAPVRVPAAPVSRPAPAPKPRPAPVGPAVPWGKRLLGHLRVILHCVVLGSILTGGVIHLTTVLDDEGDQVTYILMSAFGATLLLGIMSVVSIFWARVLHRMSSTLFFGLSSMMMLVIICAMLLSHGWSEWIEQDSLVATLLLSMVGASAWGLLIEFLCRRLDVVTAWGLPWK